MRCSHKMFFRNIFLPANQLLGVAQVGDTTQEINIQKRGGNDGLRNHTYRIGWTHMLH